MLTCFLIIYQEHHCWMNRVTREWILRTGVTLKQEILGKQGKTANGLNEDMGFLGGWERRVSEGGGGA